MVSRCVGQLTATRAARLPLWSQRGSPVVCLTGTPPAAHALPLSCGRGQGLAMKRGVRSVHSQLLWVFLRGQGLGIYPSLVLLSQREGPQGG